MDKKDIYEHLANIYLDASSKKKRKAKTFFRFRKAALIGSAFLCLLLVYSGIFLFKNKNPRTETALFITSDASKINFNFNPAKKEVYSVELNNLDLTKYKVLGFSLKKLPYNKKISVRIELVSRFKEESEVYIQDVPAHWQNYKIRLSDFKKISGWESMKRIAFTVETWNTSQDKGVVYIDNVRFLK